MKFECHELCVQSHYFMALTLCITIYMGEECMKSGIMGLAVYVARMGWKMVTVHGILVGKCKE